MKIGYARVSTNEQDPTAQRDGLAVDHELSLSDIVKAHTLAATGSGKVVITQT